MRRDQEAEPTLEVRRKRALYRAEHRGTKELDFLLGRFARASVDEMNSDEISTLERLMLEPEPLIERMILSPEQVESGDFLHMIERVRRFHGLDRLEK